MRSIRFPAAASLAALLSILPALAFHSGHIQGHILDETGAPLEGAIVTVTGPGAVGTWHCHSNARGFYRIAGLDAGRPLTITVHAPGKLSVRRTGYRLRDDQTLRLDFRLRTPESRSILAILDDTVPYHRKALQGALETMAEPFRIIEVRDEAPATARRLGEALALRPDGILAIGPVAARLARSTTFDIPVVHALVPDPRRQGLTVANMCGVPANGAFRQQMELLKETFPRIRAVGTLYVPDRLASAVAELRSAGASLGIRVEARSLHDTGGLERQLESLAGARIDAFVLLLDPQLWSPEVAGTVAAFTRREGILLLAPDEELAEAAGGISYVAGVEELGAFAGGLLAAILENRTTASQVGLAFPPAGMHDLTREELERIEAVREIMQARLEEGSPRRP